MHLQVGKELVLMHPEWPLVKSPCKRHAFCRNPEKQILVIELITSTETACKYANEGDASVLWAKVEVMVNNSQEVIRIQYQWGERKAIEDLMKDRIQKSCLLTGFVQMHGHVV